MRKALILAAIAAALAGCATPAGGPVTTQAQGAVAQVQAITRQACAFLPTAQTVASIFAAGNASLQTASSIASAICSAVGKESRGRGGRRPTVAGVTVRGQRVR